MSSILFGDTKVPIIEYDYILLLGYSILYREYSLTRFNHPKNATHVWQCRRLSNGQHFSGGSLHTSSMRVVISVPELFGNPRGPSTQ